MQGEVGREKVFLLGYLREKCTVAFDDLEVCREQS